MGVILRAMKTLVIVVLVLSGLLVLGVEVFPVQATHMALALERSRSGLTEHHVQLADGLNYDYLEGGQGPALLLLHGFGGDKDNFTRVARYLTPHYHVIIPDEIGFGLSSHPDSDVYTPEDQARHLHALLQQLGIDRVDLGGNSMGGQIAAVYASLYSATVNSLWLLDPGGVWSVPRTHLNQLARLEGHSPLIVANEDQFVELYHLVMAKPPYVPRAMLDVMAQARISNQSLEKRILGAISSDALEPHVRGLNTPTLVVWGAEDHILEPASGDVLVHLMPHARLLTMPGIGHVPMLEDPGQTAKDYLVFRASL